MLAVGVVAGTLLHPGFQLLDAAGPATAFEIASRSRPAAYALSVLAPREQIADAHGLLHLLLLHRPVIHVDLLRYEIAAVPWLVCRGIVLTAHPVAGIRAAWPRFRPFAFRNVPG